MQACEAWAAVCCACASALPHHCHRLCNRHQLCDVQELRCVGDPDFTFQESTLQCQALDPGTLKPEAHLRTLAIVLVLSQDGRALQLAQGVGNAFADLGQHGLQRDACTPAGFRQHIELTMFICLGTWGPAVLASRWT